MKKAISKEKFCSLYGEQKDRLYRYALYRLGNPEDAEDAVSDAVLAAWKGIASLKNEDAFSAWLMSILRNVCNAGIKGFIREREKAEKAAGMSEERSGHHQDPSLPVELAEALSILSDDEREIVLLSVVGGLSSKEVSNICSLAPGSVRSKLSRSLARMREYLL